jgi:hypothetical protein
MRTARSTAGGFVTGDIAMLDRNRPKRHKDLEPCSRVERLRLAHVPQF